MRRLSGEWTTLTGPSDDIAQFFAHSTHCKPDVMKRILSDICTLCVSLKFSRRCTTWGATQQPKLCIYGGLPVHFKIWLTHQYPIDPPMVFLLSNEVGCKIASNHKYVDVTGRCHVPELAAWQPMTSSLCVLVENIGRALESEGMCPLYIDSETMLSPCSDKGSRRFSSGSLCESKRYVGKLNANDVDEAEEGDQCVVCLGPKDTVLVPCGHYCLCGACSTNLSSCPICRDPVKFRQRVFA